MTALEKILAVTHTGMTIDVFEKSVQDSDCSSKDHASSTYTPISSISRCSK